MGAEFRALVLDPGFPDVREREAIYTLATLIRIQLLPWWTRSVASRMATARSTGTRDSKRHEAKRLVDYLDSNPALDRVQPAYST